MTAQGRSGGSKWWLKNAYQRQRNDKRLRPWQVERLWRAARLARHQGWTFNVFVTIYWHPIDPINDMPVRFRRGVNAMTQWLSRRGVPLASIYSHENPPVGRLNSHLAMHVPKRHLDEFKAAAPAWFNDEPGGVDVRRIYNLPGVIRYMTKGSDWGTIRWFGGDPQRSKIKQGTILSKRAGSSQSLGPKAQADYWATDTGPMYGPVDGN